MPPKKTTETNTRTYTTTVVETETKTITGGSSLKRKAVNVPTTSKKVKANADGPATKQSKKDLKEAKPKSTKKVIATKQTVPKEPVKKTAATPKPTPKAKVATAATTTTKKTAGPKTGDIAANAATKKSTAPKTTAKKTSVKQEPAVQSSTARAPRTKHTARKSAESINRPSVKKIVKKNDNIKDEDSDAESDGAGGPFDGYTGLYDVDCPTIAGEWPDFVSGDGQGLNLLYIPAQNIYWGSYDFGMYTGYFRTNAPELRDGGRGVYATFQWRGQDASEGETSFGPSNTGYLRVSSGEIKGAFRNMYGELVEFTGQRVQGSRSAAGTEAEYSHGFNSINQDEYDQANRARWGGSGW